jgi:hypothetical protein
VRGGVLVAVVGLRMVVTGGAGAVFAPLLSARSKAAASEGMRNHL